MRWLVFLYTLRIYSETSEKYKSSIVIFGGNRVLDQRFGGMYIYTSDTVLRTVNQPPPAHRQTGSMGGSLVCVMMREPRTATIIHNLPRHSSSQHSPRPTRQKCATCPSSPSSPSASSAEQTRTPATARSSGRHSVSRPDWTEPDSLRSGSQAADTPALTSRLRHYGRRGGMYPRK